MSEASASSTTTSSGSAKPGSAPAAPFSILLITPRSDVAAALIAHIDPAWAEVQVTPGGPWPDGVIDLRGSGY